jgi:hypothetical protein
MPIPAEKPTPLSLAAWTDFTIGSGGTIVIPRHGTADLILPANAPGWLATVSFNSLVRASSARKPCPYWPRILDATIGLLAAARRLGITEREVKRLLATGQLGGIKIGNEWRVSAVHCERVSLRGAGR